MPVKLVLAGGLAIIALAVVVVLSRSPLSVAATNGVPRTTVLGATEADTGACQHNETLPRGTSAIRLGLAVTIGPRVLIKVLSGGHVIAQGVRGTGWNGGSLTVPFAQVDRTYSHVTVCFQLSRLTGSVSLLGMQTGPTAAATDGNQTLPGRMTIEYLRPGERWYSLVGSAIRHMGLGRAASGTWIVVPIAALAAAVIALASWLTVRELP